MGARIYRLLRNNKEEGPFTSDELIQKNLRPYDLIWIDGRSAAWSYPGELAEFKKYIPLPDEEGTNVLTGRQKSSAVSASVQAAAVVSENINKAQKPRYRISAAWSKIQTVPIQGLNEAIFPARKEKSFVKQSINDHHSKSLSWEEAWHDWEKEKEVSMPAAEALNTEYTKTVSKTKKENNNNSPVLEVKYAESLESLEDKYIENVLWQKTHANRSFLQGKISEFIIPTLALLVIFSAGFWLLHGDKETKTALGVNSVKKEAAPVVNVNADSLQRVSNANAVNKLQATVAGNKQNIPSTQAESFNDKAVERKSLITHASKSLPATNAGVKNADAIPVVHNASIASQSSSLNASKYNSSIPAIKNVTNSEIKNQSASNSAVLNNNTVQPSINAGITSPGTNSNTATKKYNKKTSADYVSVPENITAKNGSAAIKIENISDVDLDVVVINVQYFNTMNQFYKGETLSMHNLRAGRNTIIKTPPDPNCFYVSSKVSLISSDANQVYVIGDD